MELPTSVWLAETFHGIDNGYNPLGESRDAAYFWTSKGTVPAAGPETFVLPDDPNELLVVYGVNHQASGKATYASLAVYGAKYLNGVASVDSSRFPGSAEYYLPGHPRVGYLYAWRVGRRNDGTGQFLTVPFGPQHHGFGLEADDQAGFIGFRAYLEPATGVGPLWEELLFDRVIRFRRRKP